MKSQTVAILDFGSQYTQLIARRVREQHVHSVLVGPEVSMDQLRTLGVVGLIFSGGPGSSYDPSAPRCRREVLDSGLPILGICYGMHLVCDELGGEVQATPSREYGRAQLTRVGDDVLLAHLSPNAQVWMSHGDVVQSLSAEFKPVATTPSCAVAAVRHRERPVWGLQFHPEVTHTPDGAQILRNFVYDVCGCSGDWQIGNLIREFIDETRERVKPGEKIICGLSGGVDSSVTAALLHEAVGAALVCILVDNGLLRKREREFVELTFRDHFHIDLHVVDASERFLSALRGVIDPQEKRKIIGHEFIEVFREEARTIDNAHYLAQGTLYPDVIESGHSIGGKAANIKLHHNVGGLPEELGFELIEPLRELFKDEVRVMGEHLGLPDEIVWRHPFPGPGLAVRIVGDVQPQRLALLRDVDEILIDEIRAAGWYRKIAQAFAALLPIQAVGVTGDNRSYDGTQVVVLRLVETEDFMTADWVRIDHEILSRISTRIMNDVPNVNRVVYDISSKPPATIEWE